MVEEEQKNQQGKGPKAAAADQKKSPVDQPKATAEPAKKPQGKAIVSGRNC